MTSLTDKLFAALSDEIRLGVLRPGDQIPPEYQLMKQRAVGRSVVRETISRLQQAKLVEIRRGVGTFVLGVRDDAHVILPAPDLSGTRDVMALIEFRIGTEPEAAALAATRRTEQDLMQLDTTLDRLRLAIERGNTDVLDHDVEFHMQIARASGNRYFIDVFSQLRRPVSPRTQLGSVELFELNQIGHLKRVLSEHQAIFQAISRQDPDDARAAMYLHLSNSRERFQQAHALTCSNKSRGTAQQQGRLK